MGLDKFTPETIDQLAPSKAEKPKKSSKSAKAKVSSQETDDKVPTLVPIVKPKTAKNAPPAKKVFNKKTTFGDTNSKITFDDADNSYVSQKKEVPSINLDGPKQNKKIVFDDSLIVNSTEFVPGATAAKGEKPQAFSQKKVQIPKDGSAWFNLKIKPDAPWYTQGKRLKAGPALSSTDERTKLEEEGKKLLEEDIFNFKKGNIYRQNTVDAA